MTSLVDKLLEIQHQEEPPKRGRDWGPIVEKILLSAALALVFAALAIGLVYAANSLTSHQQGTVTGTEILQSIDGVDFTSDEIWMSNWDVPVGGSQTKTYVVRNCTSSTKTFAANISWISQPTGVTASVVWPTGPSADEGAAIEVQVSVVADATTLVDSVIDFDVSISAS